MVKKVIGIIAIVGGSILLLLSLVVDLFWARAYPGFHTAQIAGVLMGVFSILIGIMLTIRIHKHNKTI
jgi:hypothetical protein